MTRYLTFRLGGADYALGLLDVQEIIGVPPITRVPLTAPIVRGVMNLRGTVIPVLDLKRQFGVSDTCRESSVVVIRARGVPLGLVVDEVLDVVALNADAIQPPPPFESSQGCVIGVATVAERVCLVLDVDRIFSYAAADSGAADRQAAIPGTR